MYRYSYYDEEIIDITNLEEGTESVINVLRNYKSICWYPAAGSDFRALLYLHERYNDVNGLTFHRETPLPDVFLFTDLLKFFAFNKSVNEKENTKRKTLEPNTIIYNDFRTKIIIKSVSKLKSIRTILRHQWARDWASDDLNSVYKMRVEVSSKYKGINATPWEVDVIYVTTENHYFCDRYLLKMNLPINYIVCIRYGTGYDNGNFLPFYFGRLGVKYYIGNSFYNGQIDYKHLRTEGIIRPDDKEFYDQWVIDRYLIRYKTEQVPNLQIIYNFDGKAWSNYGWVMWCKIIS